LIVRGYGEPENAYFVSITEAANKPFWEIFSEAGSAIGKGKVQNACFTTKLEIDIFKGLFNTDGGNQDIEYQYMENEERVNGYESLGHVLVKHLPDGFNPSDYELYLQVYSDTTVEGADVSTLIGSEIKLPATDNWNTNNGVRIIYDNIGLIKSKFVGGFVDTEHEDHTIRIIVRPKAAA
jgi:hypothetical protein